MGGSGCIHLFEVEEVEIGIPVMRSYATYPTAKTSEATLMVAS